LKVNQKRRNIVKLLPYVLAGGFAYPAGKFLFFSDNPNLNIQLPLKNINNGITYIKSSQIYIHKTQDNIAVFDAHCTHMGCVLNYDAAGEQFNCPCHKSRFDKDGTLLKGPAKRDLDKIEFTIKDKILHIG
jgi:cytochrome b6-f complex iron-sulfur subunit